MSFNPHQWYLNGLKKFAIACGDEDVISFIQATNITDTSIQTAVCQLVSDLKTNSLWTKFHAIYPIVGGTEESHRFNLIDPSLHKMSIPAVSYTHSVNGMITNTYGANLMSMSVLTKDNLAMGVYSRTNSDEQTMSFYNGTSYLQYAIRLSNLFLVDLGNFTNSIPQRITFSNSSSLGWFLNSHNSSFENQLYINDILKETQTSTEVSYSMSGMVSFNGKQGVNIGREYAFITLSQAMTETENATLYNIIQTFQTTLGRQV